MKLEDIYKELKEYLNNKIFDIIIFGSITRGKENPSDIDILIIFKEFDKKIYEELVKRYHVTSVKLDNLYSLGPIFFEILSDGYSVKLNKRLYNIFEYKSKKELTIEIKANNSKRKIFYYYLNGRKDRNKKGILEEFNGSIISYKPLIIRIPLENSDKFIRYLIDFCKRYQINLHIDEKSVLYGYKKIHNYNIDIEEINKNGSNKETNL
ncbi:nucleotidyltransferase [Nanobdella aerobiophila]|uniref:Nucleotidyltransferase n=1 Tax=Nanobdella aerobiophila TaxID=2586965 RepID=A0A915SK73_9ARCH|nr:nucleotidyltransferase domain-containing protein [Nanobdella aerobiophila]BBL45473.1 nucleotidyltransferase [Nanobdella aerobiophila]